MSAEDALRRSIIDSSRRRSRKSIAAQPRGGAPSLLDAAALLIGGMLACEGIRTRRGWIPMGLGLAVFYQGLCGLAAQESCGFDTSDAEQPDQKIASNPIDEAAWESFPASDPPTFTRQKA